MTYDRDQLLALQDSFTPDTGPFLRFLEKRDLDMSVESLRAYLDWLREQGYAAETIRKRMNGARNRIRIVFANSSEGRDVLSQFEFENRVKDIKIDRAGSYEVRQDEVPSSAEVEQLLSSDAVSARVKHFIRFFAWTGVRVSEMINIRQDDLRRHPDHYTVRIRRGKGKKERVVMLPIGLVDEINEHFKGKTYLFETRNGGRYSRHEPSDSIRDACRAILGKTYASHKFRHFFATNAIGRGRPYDAVSRYLGHADPAITLKMYSHNRLSLDDINPFSATDK